MSSLVCRLAGSGLCPLSLHLCDALRKCVRRKEPWPGHSDSGHVPLSAQNKLCTLRVRRKEHGIAVLFLWAARVVFFKRLFQLSRAQWLFTVHYGVLFPRCHMMVHWPTLDQTRGASTNTRLQLYSCVFTVGENAQCGEVKTLMWPLTDEQRHFPVCSEPPFSWKTWSIWEHLLYLYAIYNVMISIFL